MLSLSLKMLFCFFKYSSFRNFPPTCPKFYGFKRSQKSNNNDITNCKMMVDKINAKILNIFDNLKRAGNKFPALFCFS